MYKYHCNNNIIISDSNEGVCKQCNCPIIRHEAVRPKRRFYYIKDVGLGVEIKDEYGWVKDAVLNMPSQLKSKPGTEIEYPKQDEPITTRYEQRVRDRRGKVIKGETVYDIENVDGITWGSVWRVYVVLYCVYDAKLDLWEEKRRVQE